MPPPKNPADPPAVVLRVDGLCFDYPHRPLFTGLTASMKGGVCLLLGGDGSGKTTLMRLSSCWTTHLPRWTVCRWRR